MTHSSFKIFFWMLLLVVNVLYAQNQELPYTPVVTPNGTSLPWTFDGDVKVFHLVAEPVQRQFGPGIMVNCWGYNGLAHGPTIEVVEGDRVRILVTNHLPEATTVHWHGIILPNGMDGVTGLNQRPIPPGETFKYEFTINQGAGTHMYHPHYDEMTQTAMGMMGFFIIHPKNPTEEEKVDRDFAIMLQEWFVPIGGGSPNPVSMDFNYFTFNATVWPETEPLVVRKDQKVRIRLANLSMDSHPIHLHGYEFTIVAQGAKRMKPSAQYEAVTVNVPVGDTREIEFVANNPGDWAFHCHKSHHVMSGMEHDIPNLMNVKQGQIAQRIKKFLPDYMPMGETGMGQMFQMLQHEHLQGPPNYMRPGSKGQFGIIEMSGMFTVVKVRENLINYDDPGWYNNPPGTIASPIEVTECQ